MTTTTRRSRLRAAPSVCALRWLPRRLRAWLSAIAQALACVQANADRLDRVLDDTARLQARLEAMDSLLRRLADAPPAVQPMPSPPIQAAHFCGMSGLTGLSGGGDVEGWR